MANRLQENYFHWMVEWCGRMEAIEAFRKHAGINPSFIVPGKAPAYVMQSLELLGVESSHIIRWSPDHAPAQISGLLMPAFRGSTRFPDMGSVRYLRKRILGNLSLPTRPAGDVIYVQRKVGGWRYVANDEEVCTWFRAQGHVVLDPGSLSLVEQVKLFSSARLIVGMHGAGLTNIIFAPDASLIELTGSYHAGMYEHITRGLGQKYIDHACTSSGDNITVDVGKLATVVHELLREKNSNWFISALPGHTELPEPGLALQQSPHMTVSRTANPQRSAL